MIQTTRFCTDGLRIERGIMLSLEEGEGASSLMGYMGGEPQPLPP